VPVASVQLLTLTSDWLLSFIIVNPSSTWRRSPRLAHHKARLVPEVGPFLVIAVINRRGHPTLDCATMPAKVRICTHAGGA